MRSYLQGRNQTRSKGDNAKNLRRILICITSTCTYVRWCVFGLNKIYYMPQPYYYIDYSINGCQVQGRLSRGNRCSPLSWEALRSTATKKYLLYFFSAFFFRFSVIAFPSWNGDFFYFPFTFPVFCSLYSRVLYSCPSPAQQTNDPINTNVYGKLWGLMGICNGHAHVPTLLSETNNVSMSVNDRMEARRKTLISECPFDNRSRKKVVNYDARVEKDARKVYRGVSSP